LLDLNKLFLQIEKGLNLELQKMQSNKIKNEKIYVLKTLLNYVT
jgi:hypothetical protein